LLTSSHDREHVEQSLERGYAGSGKGEERQPSEEKEAEYGQARPRVAQGLGGLTLPPILARTNGRSDRVGLQCEP
jgi:hypothetical protein